MSKICYLLALGTNLWWLWRGDGLEIHEQMLVPAITAALVLLGVLFRLRALPRGAARRRYIHRALWVLAAYYLAILSVLLFFGGLFHLDRGWGGAVNTVPLHTIRSYLIYYRRTGSLISIYNLLGNVAIFIPLGVLCPVLLPWCRRWWVFLPAAALLPCAVEWLQWYTSTGIADVDDAILNFIGAALGYIVTRLCQMLYARMGRKGA